MNAVSKHKLLLFNLPTDLALITKFMINLHMVIFQLFAPTQITSTL